MIRFPHLERWGVVMIRVPRPGDYQVSEARIVMIRFLRPGEQRWGIVTIRFLRPGDYLGPNRDWVS